MVVADAEQNLGGILHLAGPERIDRHIFALRACDVVGLDVSLVLPSPTSLGEQAAPRPLNAGLISTRVDLRAAFRNAEGGLKAMKVALRSPIPILVG